MNPYRHGPCRATCTLLSAVMLVAVLAGGASFPAVTQSAAALTPQPAGLSAFYRAGQTFLTWTEVTSIAGEGYHVYRHTAPITAANLDQATRLTDRWGPLPEGTSIYYTDRDRDPGGSSSTYRPSGKR